MSGFEGEVGGYLYTVFSIVDRNAVYSVYQLCVRQLLLLLLHTQRCARVIIIKVVREDWFYLQTPFTPSATYSLFLTFEAPMFFLDPLARTGTAR